MDLDYKTYKFSSYQSMISNKETKLVRKDVLRYYSTADNFIFCHDFKSEILSDKFTLE